MRLAHAPRRHTLGVPHIPLSPARGSPGGLAPPGASAVGEARPTPDRLRGNGIDMSDGGRTLEDEGVASFTKSFDDLLGTLETERAGLDAS